ncbi:MAG: nucleoside-triphosphatase, partial [Candidatus Helarchaeota archaeon]
RGILSHVNIKGSPRVSKYGINLKALLEIGVKALDTALEKLDLIVIDEIGKMELFSPEFCESILRCFNGSKPVLATMGMNLRHSVIHEIKAAQGISTFTLTPSNRDDVYQRVLLLLKQYPGD